MSDYDLFIKYYPYSSSNYIPCFCSDWVTSDYNVVIETRMNKTQVDTLMANTRPGAVDILYSIMGQPFICDLTWSGLNTIYLCPNPSSSSDLKYRRRETGIIVKNIVTSPIEAGGGYRGEKLLYVKIDAMISGTAII